MNLWNMAKTQWRNWWRTQTLYDIPGLWNGQDRTCLYVGANFMRQHYLKDLYHDCYDITVLEGFERNVEYLKIIYPGRNYPRMRFRHGLIQHAILAPHYNLVFWWHGPEHLPAKELRPALIRLESVASLVVLGCPYGILEQGSEYGNDLEVHRQHIMPDLLEDYGYTCRTVGRPNSLSSHITAWKRC